MTVLAERPTRNPLAAACEALGLPRATAYRARTPTAAPRATRPRKESPRRIPQAERDVIFATLSNEEFADQPPHEIYATLLTRGEYLASPRTMYRIIVEQFGSVLERRGQRQPHTFAVPRIEARAPNRAWTWDITKLAGPNKGDFYYLYSVIDLFSRYVVGWMIAERESAELAEQLLSDAYERHDVWPGQLVVHSDRGAPMKSHAVADLLAMLGVARSFSRPRVSNDNPFSESSFKTMKFQPTFPRRFDSVQHARSWVATYFDWYHREHHHSGLAFFTPEDVFCGRVERVATVRQHALDQAFGRHPERFPKGPPTVRLPPTLVAINPLFATPAVELRSRTATLQQAS
jgi:putative transposase